MCGQRSKRAVLTKFLSVNYLNFFYRLNMEMNLIMFNTQRRKKLVQVNSNLNTDSGPY